MTRNLPHTTRKEQAPIASAGPAERVILSSSVIRRWFARLMKRYGRPRQMVDMKRSLSREENPLPALRGWRLEASFSSVLPGGGE